MSVSTETAARPDPWNTPESGKPKPPRRSRFVMWIGIVLIVAGLGGLGYAAYQLFFTNWLAGREQSGLSSDFAERQALAAGGGLDDLFDPNAPAGDDGLPSLEDFGETDVPVILGDGSVHTPDDVRGDGRWRPENAPPQSEVAGRIRIPDINVDWYFVSGVNPHDLRRGPGHMPRTAMPGQWGNSVISGHRTTYGSPFHRVDELDPGDQIIVDTLTGTHTYEVVSTRIVGPDDGWVVRYREGAWLTLTTCHPKFSSRERLIVFAKLVDGPNIEVINAHFDGDYQPPRP